MYLMNKKINSAILLFSLLILSCSSDSDSSPQEQNTPSLSTLELSNITVNSVESGGLNINNQTTDILDKGVCWSLNTEPTIDDFKLSSGDDSSQDFSLEIKLFLLC